MRRRHAILAIVVVFLVWNVLMYYMLKSRTPQKSISVEEKLSWMQADIQHQLKENVHLLNSLKGIKRETKLRSKSTLVKKDLFPAKLPPGRPNLGTVDLNRVTLPILVIACDRVTVNRCLDKLLLYRKDPERFPIIVSQDCGHGPTSEVIQKYVQSNGVIHLKHPDLSKIELPAPKKKFVGYYLISRHYKWALSQVFDKLNFSAVIIVEDDLDISPDFYEYFSATYPVLAKDPTLWCVSAWNDNGKASMVSNDPELLYRSDFFPGLGWMMTANLWKEIGPKWPEAFWDDWMRDKEQRKERVCIRPEICRTSTFGKKGVSKGLFYEKHLKFIKLNDQFVPFTEKDLSYLYQENYDPKFKDMVYNTPEASLADVLAGRKKDLPAVRITYTTKVSFKEAAKKLAIMEDFKAGVPRMAYRGVVSFMFKDQRIYLAPTARWKQYDLTWT